jgi:hypothetical protein
MKAGYSRDPDTTASYSPFSVLKKGKIGANFLDANLIQVAPECQNTGWLASSQPISWHFWLKFILSEAIKDCMKKDARDGSSLADLRPMHRVVPCYRLVGITPSKNKAHTPFLKLWA